MRAFIDRLLKQLREFLEKLSKKERIRLAILSVVVIVLAIVVASLLGRTKYAVLYPSLSDAEAGEIYTALQEMGIPTRMQGTTVYVPEERVSDLRATLASQGHLSDEFDYSFLESAGGFGVTDTVQKKFLEAQLGKNIDKHLTKFNKIQGSSTIVNLGETSPFAMSQNNDLASASVLLVIKGGGTLTNDEVNQVAEQVRTAVPGIKLENISISDSGMHTYKIGDQSLDLSDDISAHFAYEAQLRQQMQTQLEQLLTPIYGMSNVIVSVTPRLNFDRVVTEAVEFAPPIAGEMDGIVRSASHLYENQRTEGTEAGIPGTDTNGMGATEYPYGTLADGELYSKALLETNYEINETKTRIEEAQGSIESLSAAVLVNETAVEADYTTDILDLVSKTLGVSEEYISVKRIPFSEQSDAITEWIEAQEAAEKQQKLREILEVALMWAVILLLGLSFISLIRMIVKNIVGEKEPVAVVGGGVDYLVDENSMIYSDVDLNAKLEGVEQLEKFIERDSRAVAQLLRNWLTDE